MWYNLACRIRTGPCGAGDPIVGAHSGESLIGDSPHRARQLTPQARSGRGVAAAQACRISLSEPGRPPPRSARGCAAFVARRQPCFEPAIHPGGSGFSRASAPRTTFLCGLPRHAGAHSAPLHTKWRTTTARGVILRCRSGVSGSQSPFPSPSSMGACPPWVRATEEPLAPAGGFFVGSCPPESG